MESHNLILAHMGLTATAEKSTGRIVSLSQGAAFKAVAGSAWLEELAELAEVPGRVSSDRYMQVHILIV